MITVDKYIRKLLFEHDCVIIPEFGGLLTHHVGAHYDATNCIFLPARKRLAFNEVLKIDDGLLTYYVAAHEKLSREDAVLVVRRYVDSLRQDIQAGGTLEMDSIGTFSMNTEGKLVFEPDYIQNYNSEWFGMQSISVREVVRGEAFHEDSKVNVLDSDKESVSSLEPVTRRHTWLNWAAAAVFVGVVTLLSTLNNASDSPSLLSTLNPFETVKDLTLESYAPAPVPTLPVVMKDLPVVTIAKAPKKKAAPVEVVAYIPKNEIREVEIQRKSSSTKSKLQAETPKVTPVLQPESPKEVKYSHRYFLIAGSFGSLKNAKDLKRQLNSKGFAESQILDKPGKALIKVSAGSYATMEIAMLQKNKVDAATGADSWVYHSK